MGKKNHLRDLGIAFAGGVFASIFVLHISDPIDYLAIRIAQKRKISFSDFFEWLKANGSEFWSELGKHDHCGKPNDIIFNQAACCCEGGDDDDKEDENGLP